jgi:hypothetical protein
MTDAAAIDGVTGPGRRVQLISGDVQEVNFKLKKKIIEVMNKDGTMGQYDMAVVGSVQVSSDGKDFTLAVIAKEDADARTEQDAKSGTIETTGSSVKPNVSSANKAGR